MGAGYAPGIAVLCIGNPTLGGSGKTPTVRAIAKMLQAKGLKPHVISRGYGGKIQKSIQVDPLRHDAATVGDEPLLIARDAITWVGADRVLSARKAVAAGADVLLMDDGFQSPSLRKLSSWLVVDGPAGLGNRRVFPAGPLRESFPDAVARADVLVMIGSDRQALAGETDLPIAYADLIHPEEALVAVGDRAVFAFAGIGRPAKFFKTLADAGVNIVGSREFPDHHQFTARELRELRQASDLLGASLVTTEKDFTRLNTEERIDITAIPILVRWRNPGLIGNLLERSITLDAMR